MVVRVPGTVLIHFVVDLADDGSARHSRVDFTPLGTQDVSDEHVTADFRNDSAFVDMEVKGQHRKTTVALASKPYPQFMTGFRAYYGLYESPAFFPLYGPLSAAGVGDTVRMTTFDIGTGRPDKRILVKRSPTEIDLDYFQIGRTRVTVDGTGHVVSMDASGTTEQTMTHRSDALNVEALAKRFAMDDKAGKGIGSASPPAIERGSVGGSAVVIGYNSPRRRGRTILGHVVRYDDVWRTGANEATTLFSDKSLMIGGKTIPAGTYSLWTLPRANGTVDLIINSQHGQWGTNYDASHDVVHVPMKVTTSVKPIDDFAIHIVGDNSQQLQIAWDTFVWSVPIALAQ
jgi:hypothetical protein